MLSTYLTGGNSSLMTKELVETAKAWLLAAFFRIRAGGVFSGMEFTNIGVGAPRS